MGIVTPTRSHQNCKSMELLSLVAEIELIYKPCIKKQERGVIKDASSAVDLLRNLWKDDLEVRERMMLLLVNQAGEVIGYHELGSGGIAGVLADKRILFGVILKAAVPKFIIAHNHPSGSMAVSKHDQEFTDKIKSSAEMLDLKFLDHIILTADSYVSLAESGLM